MFAISVNNQFIDFGNAVISITMYNPIFDRDSITRVFSNPINAPANARNKAIFQHADRIDHAATVEKYAAKLYIQGVLFEQGVLTISKTTSKVFRLVFKNKILELLEALKLLKLADLDFPQSIGYSYQPTYVFDLKLPVPAGGIQFEAIQINADIFKVIAGDHLQLVEDINAVYPNMVTVFINTGIDFSMILHIQDPTTPMYINTHPNVENSAFFEISVFANFSEDPASVKMREAWTSHLDSLLENPTTHVFPVFKNEQFFEGKEEFTSGEVSFFGYLNHYHHTGQYSFNTQPQDKKTWRHSLVPFTFLKAVLDAFVEHTAIDAYDGDFYHDPEIQSLLIANNKTLDRLVNEDLEATAFQWLNVWLHEYNLNNHLPNASAYDLFLDLSSTFCLVYDFENGHFQMDTCRDRLATPEEDWTHLAEPQYGQSYPEKQIFTLDYNRQGDETTYEEQLRKVNGGTEANEFVSQFYTFHSKREIDLPDFVRSWRIPFCNEKGSSEAIGLQNEASKRLLFWRGMQPDLAGNLYPFASAFDRDSHDAEIADTQYTLDWNGEKGLYEQWWKAYIHLLVNGRPVEKTIRLNINQLQAIKQFRTPRKRIYHDKGEMVGVVKKVSFKASSSRLFASKVELVKEKTS